MHLVISVMLGWSNLGVLLGLGALPRALAGGSRDIVFPFFPELDLPSSSLF